MVLFALCQTQVHRVRIVHAEEHDVPHHVRVADRKDGHVNQRLHNADILHRIMGGTAAGSQTTPRPYKAHRQVLVANGGTVLFAGAHYHERNHAVYEGYIAFQR